MGATRLHMICLLIPVLCCSRAVAQYVGTDTLSGPRLITLNPRYYKSHDSLWVYSGICKTLDIKLHTGKDARHRKPGLMPASLLQVHGNVQYDFVYRSLVDTPFSQTGFRQHTVQTTMNFVLKQQYPFRVTVLSRQSNSPYFDDMTDVNVQFSRGMFLQQLKNGLNRSIVEQAGRSQLTHLENMYQQKKAEVLNLQNWLNHPARIQEVIQYREAAVARGGFINNNTVAIPDAQPGGVGGLTGAGQAAGYIPPGQRRAVNAPDSIGGMAVPANRAAGNNGVGGLPEPPDFQRKRGALEKALRDLKSYEDRIGSVKRSLRDSVALMQQQLAGITDPAQLKQFAKEHQLNNSRLPRSLGVLASIQQIGLGRTWVDYSELTVKNISLTGINVEANPSRLYVAFAAGRVNFRFRDFVVSNRDQPAQSLYLVRAGVGRKEGNNLIFTWYDGKRNLLQSFGGTSVALRPERVIGLSMQTRLQLDPGRYIILESAKSSFHNTGAVNQGASGLMDKVWNFRNRTNEAYSVTLNASWPRTASRISGYYRRMGEHFQSFNLQPVNVAQEAFQLKAQQYFWKRRLTVEAGLRKNDFSNPLIYPGVSSQTVFKSVQATLRVPRYPFISAGYYPSTQLTALDNNVIAENQYQTLSVMAGHTWRVKGAGMSANAVYLKFFNNSTDSGFIYFNASSWSVNHTVFLKNFQFQSGFSAIRQQQLRMNTLEQTVHWQAGKWLSLSGGLKYNRLNGAETLWGGTGGLSLHLGKLGTLQAAFDRSYLPGTGRNLLPVNMGKLTFYRVF